MRRGTQFRVYADFIFHIYIVAIINFLQQCVHKAHLNTPELSLFICWIDYCFDSKHSPSKKTRNRKNRVLTIVTVCITYICMYRIRFSSKLLFFFEYTTFPEMVYNGKRKSVCVCCIFASKSFRKCRWYSIFLLFYFCCCCSLKFNGNQASISQKQKKKRGGTLQVQVHCFNLTYNSNYGGNKLTMVHFRIIMRKSLYVEQQHRKKLNESRKRARTHTPKNRRAAYVQNGEQWAFNFNRNALLFLSCSSEPSWYHINRHTPRHSDVHNYTKTK